MRPVVSAFREAPLPSNGAHLAARRLAPARMKRALAPHRAPIARAPPRPTFTKQQLPLTFCLGREKHALLWGAAMSSKPDDKYDLSKVEDPKPKKIQLGGMNTLFGYTPNLGPKKSLATIMHLAMFADGSASPDEYEEIVALMDRTRCFSKTSHRDSQKLLDTVSQETKKKKPDEMLELASRSFRGKPSAESVFMLAADILLADRAFLDNERRLLRNLAFCLQINKARAEGLLDVMHKKNRH